MRKPLILLAFMASMSTANGAEYRSQLGFQFEAPNHWLVLSPESVDDDYGIFAANSQSSGEDGTNTTAIVEERIKQGEVEVLYNQNSASVKFSDNIVYQKNAGSVPQSEEERQIACSHFPQQLREQLAREVEVSECRLTSVGDSAALYIEFQGVTDDTEVAQYLIQAGAEIMLVATLTSRRDSMAENRREFAEIIASLRFD